MRGATLRRDLITVPARFAAPARKPVLHLPAHWPSQIGWKTLWDNIIGYSPGLDGVSARNIHPSPPDSTTATQYVLNVSLTFGHPDDAEQAEKQLAATAFNGLVGSWSEVEEVRW